MAVITLIPLWGPLALLAVVAPFLFGGAALFVRRWLVLLTISSLGSTLYLVHVRYAGYLKASGLDGSAAFWGALALLGAIGVVWSRIRQLRAMRTDQQAALLMPRRVERVLLWAVGLLGIIAVGYCLAQGSLGTSPWQGLLAVWVVAWAGGLHVAYLCWAGSDKVACRWMLSTEGTMLSALVAAAVALGLATGPRSPDPWPRLVWTFEPVERGAIVSSPLVDDKRVYVAAIRNVGFSPSGVVYCLDRETGAVLWQFDDDGDMQHMFSSPCLADGLLYIGEGMHANFRCKLYCLEVETGKKRWHFEAAGHIESSPCVADGLVYFGAGDDGIHCLDAASGAPRWHFHGPYHIDSNPAVVGGRLYVGSGVSARNKTTEVLCLNAQTGQVVWRYPTSIPAWGSPRVDGDQVFIGLGTGRLERRADPGETAAGALICLDATTGRLQWSYSVSEGVFGKSAVDEQQVYFGSRNGWCYAVDRRTGQLKWQEHLGSPIIASPALSAGRLYVVPTAGKFSCFDVATKQLLWSFDVAELSQTKPRIYSSPTVLRMPDASGPHHRIYFGSELRNPVTSAAVLYCLED